MPESLKKLIWPLLALLLLFALNFWINPQFFYLAWIDGRWVGTPVDVLLRAAPIMLTALGMTLVIATGGVDLSVGALMAMAGSLAAVLLVQYNAPLWIAIGAALLLCALAGLWNGVLVALVRVQPIVATLILMVAGRGIAQLLTDGQIITVKDHPGFKFLGSGALAGLPVAVWIVALVAVALAALTRLTALGLFIEAIGSNETASRFAGLNVRSIRVAVYTLSGLCAGVAGVVSASNISAADANNAGLYMELDAILAVVIGGTALTGGRFLLIGSLIGALIIQTLTTTVLMSQWAGESIPAEYNLIVKAIVVLVVCLLQSPRLRRLLLGRWGDA